MRCMLRTGEAVTAGVFRFNTSDLNGLGIPSASDLGDGFTMVFNTLGPNILAEIDFIRPTLHRLRQDYLLT